MIPIYSFRRLANIFGKKIEIQTYIINSNQSKHQKIIVQNLRWKILFQKQVKFLKSGIWFQFYNASNKDTFFDSPGIFFKDEWYDKFHDVILSWRLPDDFWESVKQSQPVAVFFGVERCYPGSFQYQCAG